MLSFYGFAVEERTIRSCITDSGNSCKSVPVGAKQNVDFDIMDSVTHSV